MSLQKQIKKETISIFIRMLYKINYKVVKCVLVLSSLSYIISLVLLFKYPSEAIIPLLISTLFLSFSILAARVEKD